MFRNQYDTDVTTWSPQGRLFQVEYAMEAIKQGSACVGLCSCTHAVLVAVNKPASELSSYQRKVFRVAEHAGVALAPHGLHIVLSSRDAAKGQDVAGRILAEAPDDMAVIVESRRRRRADGASVEAFAAWAVENNGRRAVLAASTMQP